MSRTEYEAHCAAHHEAMKFLRDKMESLDPEDPVQVNLYHAWKFLQRRHRRWVETTTIT